MGPRWGRQALTFVTVSILLASGACAGTEKDATVVLKDFSLSMVPASTASGDIRLWIEQRGQQQHELALYRGKEPKDLPTRPDGTIDVTKWKPVDGVKALTAGTYKSTLSGIRYGDYVLACNLVTDGEAHFAKGMALGIRITRSRYDSLFDAQDE